MRIERVVVSHIPQYEYAIRLTEKEARVLQTNMFLSDSVIKSEIRRELERQLSASPNGVNT